ncbi:hypothetical protein HJFPF1_01650 [Paramyrothecium foliicola]|nr:hypothetical protein HJFPF1_01650 [Paramyrothecium foliicola]
MCTYARTLFSCKHESWGQLAKRCIVAQDYLDGVLPFDCVSRTPHGFHSKKLPRRCDKCISLESKLKSAREKLEHCRRAFHEAWPDYDGAADSVRLREDDVKDVGPRRG